MVCAPADVIAALYTLPA